MDSLSVCTAVGAAERKPLSKRARFTVFKRDAFTCQYRGATPPAVVLEVDHVLPVAKGGGNDPDNLITACFDCNRGKAAGLLTEAPVSLLKRAEIRRELQEQTRAYEKLLRSIRMGEEKAIASVEAIFRSRFNDCQFTPIFRESVRRFIRQMPACAVEDAMEIACMRIPDGQRALKYFCGICWRDIRGPRT